MILNRRQLLQLTFTSIALTACKSSRKRVRPLSAGATVLALGDSLTFGYGAAQGADYPTQLAQITGWRVINGGISGDTSAQALARLPELMQQHQPQLVLVSIGGNDFLRKLPESETRHHIDQILTIIQKAQVPAVLVAIPALTTGALLGNLQDHDLYQDLAKTHHIPLLKGAWAEILSQPQWKSDHIHANELGYHQFAEKMADFLKKQGLWR